MLNFDEKKAIKTIISRTGCTQKTAFDTMLQLKKVHASLHPHIIDWVNGGEGSFEFFDITSDEIMQKEKASYVQAVFRMSSILNNPESAERYKKRRFLWK